jgi:hypothetical protein
MRFPTQRNIPPSNFASKEIQSVDGILNYDQLTETLGYSGSHLASFRFNA